MSNQQEQLALHVKQMHRTGGQVCHERWRSFCDLYNGGKFDPAKASVETLQTFIETEERGGVDFESCSAFEQLLVKVKSGQRTDEAFKEAWGEYCADEMGGVRDPSRHTENSLKKFLHMVGQYDGPMPEPLPESASSKGSGRSQKGGHKQASTPPPHAGVSGNGKWANPPNRPPESDADFLNTPVSSLAPDQMMKMMEMMSGGSTPQMPAQQRSGGCSSHQDLLNTPVSQLGPEQMAQMMSMINNATPTGGNTGGCGSIGAGCCGGCCGGGCGGCGGCCGGGCGGFCGGGGGCGSGCGSGCGCSGGFGAGGGERPGVIAVVFGQRSSEHFRQSWDWYCGFKGNGNKDPTKYDDHFLSSFFDTIAGAAMSGQEDDSSRENNSNRSQPYWS